MNKTGPNNASSYRRKPADLCLHTVLAQDRSAHLLYYFLLVGDPERRGDDKPRSVQNLEQFICPLCMKGKMGWCLFVLATFYLLF
jgi:hypothetical protein